VSAPNAVYVDDELSSRPTGAYLRTTNGKFTFWPFTQSHKFKHQVPSGLKGKKTDGWMYKCFVVVSYKVNAGCPFLRIVSSSVTLITFSSINLFISAMLQKKIIHTCTLQRSTKDLKTVGK